MTGSVGKGTKLEPGRQMRVDSLRDGTAGGLRARDRRDLGRQRPGGDGPAGHQRSDLLIGPHLLFRYGELREPVLDGSDARFQRPRILPRRRRLVLRHFILHDRICSATRAGAVTECPPQTPNNQVSEKVN